MISVLSINGLSKKYDDFEVLKNISLNIEKGDIYGLIGRNGAGKTTLMKTIIGSTSYQSGTLDLFEEEFSKNKIGCIIEEPSLYMELNAYENMKIHALLVRESDESKIKEILSSVGLNKVGNKKVKNYSIGMKQRLGIALSLVGNPDLLIWDEPINGLDPIGIKDMRNLIIKLNKQGTTFLISSHILSELDKLVTKYGFIEEGKMICELSQKELEERKKQYVTIVTQKQNIQILENGIQSKYNFGNRLSVANGEIIIQNFIEDYLEFCSEIKRMGITDYTINIQQKDIEEIYLELLEDEKID